MDLAGLLQAQFADFTCRNNEIHFSAGICLKKPNTPLRKLALEVEQALEASKDSGRNKITVFGETVTWKEYARLRQIKEIIKQWHEDKLINNAMLFRLNAFIGLANLEKEVLREGGVKIEDMECLKWRSLFRYTTERNIGKMMKDETDRKKARERFGAAASWLDEFGGRLRIALWDLIYNQR